MLGDSVNFSASRNPTAGMEYNTTHPVIQLKIKGEKEERRKVERMRRGGREKMGGEEKGKRR